MNIKEKILQGGAALFFRYGIKSVTMDDIARHLSMSKKTIYQFFRDKDEIVHTMMELEFERDKIEFEEITKKSSNAVEEVFHFMKKMHALLEQINPNIFYDLQKYHPNTWQLFHRFRTEWALDQVKETIQRGQREGLFRMDMKSDVLSRLRVEQIHLGFDPKVFTPDKFKILDVQIAITEHFLYGICTLKGHKLINKYRQVVEEE
jgi:AcrR family transcriptional regulator